MTVSLVDPAHGGLTDDVPYTAATALWTVIWTALIPQRGGSGICYSLMAANATARLLRPHNFSTRAVTDRRIDVPRENVET
jgi:hypothetical protein